MWLVLHHISWPTVGYAQVFLYTNTDLCYAQLRDPLKNMVTPAAGYEHSRRLLLDGDKAKYALFPWIYEISKIARCEPWRERSRRRTSDVGGFNHGSTLTGELN